MRPIWKYTVYFLPILAIIFAIAIIFALRPQGLVPQNIKVGLLFSKTGTMADSELPVIKAILLAIDEINEQGGIDRRKIVPVIYDAQSDPKRYAALAEKLITQDKVKVIFGGWTSASRKEIKPIIEKYNNLLIYPTQYEGVEESSNIIYLGATPNQQIVPAVSWVMGQGKKKAFLVGSDYIYPHVANEILVHQIKTWGGEVVGERYVPLGGMNVDSVVNEIIQKKPDIIFNTINGDTNVAFFNRLFELTRNRSRPLVVSFSLANADINKIGADKMIGDYAVWSYFCSQTNPENERFLKAYSHKYHDSARINDPAVTAYAGVYLWAQAVHDSPTLNPAAIHDFMLRQSFASPAGIIYIDPENANAWRTVVIGKINDQGVFQVEWSSINPVEPIIYPDFKTKAEWELFEYQLYNAWKKSWINTN